MPCMSVVTCIAKYIIYEPHICGSHICNLYNLNLYKLTCSGCRSSKKRDGGCMPRGAEGSGKWACPFPIMGIRGGISIKVWTLWVQICAIWCIFGTNSTHFKAFVKLCWLDWWPVQQKMYKLSVQLIVSISANLAVSDFCTVIAVSSTM